ncbi:MAG: bifunctional 4-hydroxy-2-oxoglutarate aldolase/2-dehydro-3-deoxy-phosphogluconate aldolase [Actinomycetota bacterium]
MTTVLPDAITQERVISVARRLDASTAPALAEALLEGGLSSLEVTVEGPGGIDALESLRDTGMTVGAGTVVSIDQAAAATAAGARFLVSPHLDLGLIDWARDHGVPLIPGALTPTEVAMAWMRRPPAVKIFPAHLGGPGYLKSLLGPYPDLALIPTGGVDADNAGAFLSAGAVAVGVGGWLTGHADLAEVTRRARLLVARVV